MDPFDRVSLFRDNPSHDAYQYDACQYETKRPLINTQVYADIRAVAAAALRRESSDHTLDATDLAHVVLERLLRGTKIDMEDRVAFFAVLGTAMRNYLVDHARRKMTAKRKNERERIDFHEACNRHLSEDFHEVLAVHDALHVLAIYNSRAAKVVELRYFGGMTVDETAVSLGISPRTAADDWYFARTWLHAELSNDCA